MSISVSLNPPNWLVSLAGFGMISLILGFEFQEASHK